jgi:hypothetical protein
MEVEISVCCATDTVESSSVGVMSVNVGAAFELVGKVSELNTSDIM